MSDRTNITRIKAVYNALGPLKNEVVFVGGATVSLYADNLAAEVRPTDDVDILVEISSRWKFAEIEQQLREMGFQHDREAKFLGRYLLHGLIVDVMPTDENILGFSNQWYSEGFSNAVVYVIDDQHKVKIFSPPYFIASKIEAFKNRGNNDGRTSSDFEDIVYVLENRRSIWEEMKQAQPGVSEYLKKEFKKFSKNRFIEEWIEANASFFSPPSSYYIMQELKDFVSTK
jgi:predicted nucleotidyltransferase